MIPRRSVDIDAKGRSIDNPAELMSTSIGPICLREATAESIDELLRRSQCTNLTRSRAAPEVKPVLNLSAFRPSTTTSPPRSITFIIIFLPMPEVAPVMTTRFPKKNVSCSLLVRKAFSATHPCQIRGT